MKYINPMAFLVGFGLCTAGVCMIYLPAGLIVAGVILMAVSIFGGRQ